MSQAHETRGKSVLRLTRLAPIAGGKRGALGFVYNVTDAELARIGSGDIHQIPYRRCDRDVTDATHGTTWLARILA
jgi:hypothetical protein